MRVGRFRQIVSADLLPAVGAGPSPKDIALGASYLCPVQFDRSFAGYCGQDRLGKR